MRPAGSPKDAFPAWLADRLRASGHRQSDLARALGRHPSAVSNMLKGKRRPRPDEIQIIAGLINASFEEVVAAWAVRSPLVGQKGFAEMNQVEFEPLPKDLLTGTAPIEKIKHQPA